MYQNEKFARRIISSELQTFIYFHYIQYSGLSKESDLKNVHKQQQQQYHSIYRISYMFIDISDYIPFQFTRFFTHNIRPNTDGIGKHKKKPTEIL